MPWVYFVQSFTLLFTLAFVLLLLTLNAFFPVVPVPIFSGLLLHVVHLVASLLDLLDPLHGSHIVDVCTQRFWQPMFCYLRLISNTACDHPLFLFSSWRRRSLCSLKVSFIICNIFLSIFLCTTCNVFLAIWWVSRFGLHFFR